MKSVKASSADMQIRELLEKLLDDDEDMRDMNLSARSGFHALRTRAVSVIELGGASGVGEVRTTFRASSTSAGTSTCAAC